MIQFQDLEETPQTIPLFIDKCRSQIEYETLLKKKKQEQVAGYQEQHQKALAIREELTQNGFEAGDPEFDKAQAAVEHWEAALKIGRFHLNSMDNANAPLATWQRMLTEYQAKQRKFEYREKHKGEKQ